MERALVEESGDLGLCPEPDVLAKWGELGLEQTQLFSLLGGEVFPSKKQVRGTNPLPRKTGEKMLPRIDGPRASASELPSKAPSKLPCPSKMTTK